MTHVVDPDYIAERLTELERLAELWKPLPASAGVPLKTGYADETRPRDIDYITHEEFVALALVLERDHEVLSPVGAFITLPYWLQRWVLERWHMSAYIGLRLGMPE